MDKNITQKILVTLLTIVVFGFAVPAQAHTGDIDPASLPHATNPGTTGCNNWVCSAYTNSIMAQGDQTITSAATLSESTRNFLKELRSTAEAACGSGSSSGFTAVSSCDIYSAGYAQAAQTFVDLEKSVGGELVINQDMAFFFGQTPPGPPGSWIHVSCEDHTGTTFDPTMRDWRSQWLPSEPGAPGTAAADGTATSTAALPVLPQIIVEGHDDSAIQSSAATSFNIVAILWDPTTCEPPPAQKTGIVCMHALKKDTACNFYLVCGGNASGSGQRNTLLGDSNWFKAGNATQTASTTGSNTSAAANAAGVAAGSGSASATGTSSGSGGAANYYSGNISLGSGATLGTKLNE